MHSKTMWPMHGKYICPDCLREYPVLWEENSTPAPAKRARNEAFVPTAAPVVHHLVGRLKRFGTM